MKVLHITEVAKGGTASYLEDLVPAQLEAFGKDMVVVLVPEHDLINLPSLPDQALRSFRHTGRNLLSLLRFARLCANLIKSEKPDIVHLHSTFAGVVVRPLFRLLKVRSISVYCAHGWAFLRDERASLRWIYQRIEQFLSRWTGLIINISEFEHRAALSIGISEEKCRLIRSGINAEVNVPDFGLMTPDADKLNLLYVGRFDRQKGFDILLDIFAQLDPAKFHLHIVGGPAPKDEFDAQLNEFSNLTYYGWIPRQDIGYFYTNADILIMPSRLEGFGLVAIEAMKHGLPVLASDRGALPEIVLDGKVGWVFSIENPKAVAKIMNNIDQRILNRFSCASKKRFEQEFTSEKMNKNIVSLYTDLFENHCE